MALDGDDVDADFPDGTWTGFDQDEGRAVRQDLHLTFACGLVAGIGVDGTGEFLVDGRYDPQTQEVVITKRYPGCSDQPQARYRGFREVHGIWGTQDQGGPAAGFHIWPTGEGAPETAPPAATAPGAVPSWLFRI